MGLTRSSTFTAFFGRNVLIIIVFCSLSFSANEVNGHPVGNGGWSWSGTMRAANQPAFGNRQDPSTMPQSALNLPRMPVKRSVGARAKDEHSSERHRPVKEKMMNITALARDPSTDSDGRPRAARKSPAVKITAPIFMATKETTLSPLSIQVKTFTPQPNVSAVIEVIADNDDNKANCKHEKESMLEYSEYVADLMTDQPILLNWYLTSDFNYPRGLSGTFSASTERPNALSVEESILLGPGSDYGNQQPKQMYSQYSPGLQNYLPSSSALGTMQHSTNLYENAPVPLVSNMFMSPQWFQGMKPLTQKYVTNSFHLKSDPKLEWVPI